MACIILWSIVYTAATTGSVAEPGESGGGGEIDSRT